MKTAGHQVGARLSRELCGLTRRRQLPAEQIADKRLRGRIRCVVDDEAPLAKDAFEPAAERVGHADARRVGRPQIGDERRAELCRGKNLFELGEDVGDVIVERHGGDWQRIARSRREAHGASGHLAVEDRTRPDFVPVVVFGLNPKDGHGRRAVFPRHLLGQLQGGERFEDREERSAEEPCLLSGQDGDGPRIGEPFGRRQRGCWRAASLLLRAKHRGKFRERRG